MKQVQGHGRLLPRNLIQGNSSTALCALLIFVVVGPTRVAAESEVDASEMFTTTERWVYGLLTGVVLGLIGFLCAGVVVYLKKFTTINYESSLKVLVAFAAGALIGDALIHMIPEAFSVEEVSDPLDPRLLSFFICLGIFVFALLERIFYLFGIAHSHGSDGREHDHDHGDQHDHHDHKDLPQNNEKQSYNPAILNKQKSIENIIEQAEKDNYRNHNHIDVDGNKHVHMHIHESQEDKLKEVEGTQNNCSDKTETDKTVGWKDKKPEAFLNQLGDFLHNIMDGIALGVGFSSNQRSIVTSTIIAIIAHEIPQEMGNASILMNSNFSAKQAMMCNGLVNFSAIIGIFIGISVANLDDHTNRIMSCFIAGNFLYIGATEMLPKLSQEKSNKHAVYQLLGLIAGFGVMFLVTLLEPESK